MKNLFFIKVVIFSSVVAIVFGQDYCDRKLCGSKGPHVGCKNPGKFSFFCPKDRTAVTLSENDKETILDSHNSFRNIIASGSIGSFCSASRMATMQWSTELENLAKLNVLQCKMNADTCRNTFEFKNVGQNLALQQQTGSFMATTTAIIKTIQSWFYEYRQTNQTTVDSCCGKNFLEYEHFLQMVNDRATHIGCAISRFSDTTKNVLIACNYASGNAYRHKVYKCGKSATECSRGTNPRYKALCNVNEPIDANQMY
ncbi:antigen 5 like allergen Cul n 1-like [Chironomus tepperi]|uniref:antigen 5 like allergen Cul n 1-like n=1 Tax=Chironomus tepperi TaxID=113505 RepID=UPI00391FA638